MRKSLLAIVGAGALAGCTTANYNSNDVTRINNSDLDHRYTQFVNSAQTPLYRSGAASQFDATLAEKTIKSFDHAIPRGNFTVYSIQPVDGKSDLTGSSINTAGPLNAVTDELILYKALVPADTERSTQLVIGPADHLVLSRSEANQLSNTTGLQALEFYGPTTAPAYFDIAVNESTGVNSKLRNEATYTVNIKFNVSEEKLRLRKERADGVFALETAETAALGYALFNIPGLVGGVSVKGLEGIIGLAEGSHAPTGTQILNGQHYVGLPEREAIVSHILQTAKKLGANDIVLLPLQSQGESLGVIYATNAKNVKLDGETVSFTTTIDGVNHLAAFAVGAANQVIYGAAGKVYENINHNCPPGSTNNTGPNPPGVSGGQSGSPGGVNPTSSGGLSGGQQGGLPGGN